MRFENVIETSHWKLLISDIRPRHTSTALAAHFCATAHRLGSTALRSLFRVIMTCHVQDALHNVAKATLLSRLLYASPSC